MLLITNVRGHISILCVLSLSSSKSRFQLRPTLPLSPAQAQAHYPHHAAIHTRGAQQILRAGSEGGYVDGIGMVEEERNK